MGPVSRRNSRGAGSSRGDRGSNAARRTSGRQGRRGENESDSEDSSRGVDVTESSESAGDSDSFVDDSSDSGYFSDSTVDSQEESSSDEDSYDDESDYDSEEGSSTASDSESGTDDGDSLSLDDDDEDDDSSSSYDRSEGGGLWPGKEAPPGMPDYDSDDDFPFTPLPPVQVKKKKSGGDGTAGGGGGGHLEGSDSQQGPGKSVRFDNASIRATQSAQQTKARKRPGKLVRRGHKRYAFMLALQRGIYEATGRVSAEPQRAISGRDFKSTWTSDTLSVGEASQPKYGRLDFTFKEYAGMAFRHIREYFNINPSDFLMSLTGHNCLSELGSPGKSGQLFYFTQDMKFILKTVTPTEQSFFRKILKDYYLHVKNNPNTLLVRFYGMYRVKPVGRKAVYFVIMANVFENQEIHEIYDLKGSTVGRLVPDSKRMNPAQVKKDLDFEILGRKIYLGGSNRQPFLEQLERDAAFLQSKNVMDYSVLLGVQYRSQAGKGKSENALPGFQVMDQEALAQLEADNAYIYSTRKERKKYKRMNRKAKRKDKRAYRKEVKATAKEYKRARKAGGEYHTPGAADLFTPPRRVRRSKHEGALRKFEDGTGIIDGFDDHTGEQRDEVYYMGIIDILQQWNYVKKGENKWKLWVMRKSRKGLSAVPPKPYKLRFVDYMGKITV